MKLCYHDSLELAVLESHACPMLESMVTAPCQVSKKRQQMDREEGSRVEATTEKNVCAMYGLLVDSQQHQEKGPLQAGLSALRPMGNRAG